VEEALAGNNHRAAVKCLLLFDFLVGHVDKDRGRYAPVVANARKLLDAARKQAAIVVHARADHAPGTPALNISDTEHRPPRIMHGTPAAEIIPELAPQPSDYQLPKHRWSAFHGTHLDHTLRSRGADTIFLCGGSTEIGIASTAYAARDFGYNVVIVSDACTSPKHDVHALLMGEVFPRLARVRTTAQALGMLED
jgi:ureidoacrylate peracid hydrolase